MESVVKGTLFAALETMCQDTLESSVVQVRQRPSGDQITDAMQRLIWAYDALEGIEDSEPALDVGLLGKAYLDKQRAVAKRALDGLPFV
jgi:hypothetical protein